jgi:hypothetical protein
VIVKRTPLKTLTSIALGLLGLSATANDIEPGKEFYNVVYAPKAITLDGDSGRMVRRAGARGSQIRRTERLRLQRLPELRALRRICRWHLDRPR